MTFFNLVLSDSGSAEASPGTGHKLRECSKISALSLRSMRAALVYVCTNCKSPGIMAFFELNDGERAYMKVQSLLVQALCAKNEHRAIGSRELRIDVGFCC
jgi:hypothetical protein